MAVTIIGCLGAVFGGMLLAERFVQIVALQPPR